METSIPNLRVPLFAACSGLRRFRELWPDEPTAAYDAWTQLSANDNHHEKQGRSTGRLVISAGTQKLAVYIKKYFCLPWWQRWFSPLECFARPTGNGAIGTGSPAGHRASEVVAAGVDRRNRAKAFWPAANWKAMLSCTSISLALAAPSGRSIRLRNGHWPTGRRHRPQAARRQLYHLDFYLCHFLIRENAQAPDGFDLVLIDFLRLKHSSRRRWLVKDLGQLLFSSYMPGSRTHRMRFWKHYLGVKRFDAAARRQLHEVVAKAERYLRHNADGTRFTKFD